MRSWGLVLAMIGGILVMLYGGIWDDVPSHWISQGCYRRVFDCFLYSGEAYMLYLRLRTLSEHVDRFVIGFSERSFANDSLVNRITVEPFAREIRSFQDKILWLNLTLEKNALLDRSLYRGQQIAWRREATVRNGLLKGLRALKAKDSDIVLLSDVDELPFVNTIEYIREHPPVDYYNLHGQLYHANMRWFIDDWQRPVVISYGSLSRPLNDYKFLPKRIVSPEVMHVHCSFCFPTVSEVVQKLRSFSHVEFGTGLYLNRAYLVARLICARGLIPMDRMLPGGKVVKVKPRLSAMPFNFINITDQRLMFLSRPLGFTDMSDIQLSEVLHFVRQLNCTVDPGIMRDLKQQTAAKE